MAAADESAMEEPFFAKLEAMEEECAPFPVVSQHQRVMITQCFSLAGKKLLIIKLANLYLYMF